jgi:putative FmdB family regulatory protein
MPLYEYKCSKCGSVFEVIQKVTETPLKKCLKCGAPAQKVISPPALQFKGSGWYITDYAQKSSNPAQKKESPKKQEPPAKTDKKDGSSSSSPSSEPS